MHSQVSLQIADYIVMAVMLLIPVSIGVFFAVRDSKRATRDEYLLGGRRMTMLPVSLSIFVTFLSAVSLMGTPTEIYMFGPMFVVFYVGFAVSFVISYFTMVPLMYPLQLTSVYEYLHLRFQSQAVRFVFLGIGMLQSWGAMVVYLLTPGLALQAAAGFPLWVSVVIVGIIGTLYTAIGGIKSVVWADAFQALLMYGAPIMIIVSGSVAVGGWDKVWHIAEAGGRTAVHDWSFDPRMRNSWLGSLMGGLFMFLTHITSQATLQRISAVKTLEIAKRCQLVNIPIVLTFIGILFACGLSMYAYFVNLGCDPYEAGIITNRNQLPPYFALHSMSNLPGLAGLYMVGLFSASLSSISSGLNALAANTVEDILKRPLSTVKESTATLVTKLAVCVYGLFLIGLTYIMKSLKGPVTQMGASAISACGGPIVGVFALAASIPWANKYGALSGGFAALILNIWMAIGSQMTGKRLKPLPPPPSDHCFSNTSTSAIVNDMSPPRTFHDINAHPNVTFEPYLASTPNITESDNSFSFFLYDISYEWYGFIGAFFSFTLGLIVSYCTRRYVQSQTNSEFIFSFLRKFWSLPEPKPVTDSKSIIMAKAEIEAFKNKEILLIVKEEKEELQVQERCVDG